MSLIIRLAILTGQRRSEIAGAQISEFHELDGKSPVWVIPGDQRVKGRIVKGRTKNGREQRVPLSNQGAKLVREAIQASSSKQHLFPVDMRRVRVGSVPKTPHTNASSVTWAMKQMCERLGIENLTLHDFRRAISGWCKDNDVSRDVRDLILNHVDRSVTGANYERGARMERQVRVALQSYADHVWQVTGQGLAKDATNVHQLRSA